mgnify:FL=1
MSKKDKSSKENLIKIVHAVAVVLNKLHLNR